MLISLPVFDNLLVEKCKYKFFVVNKSSHYEKSAMSAAIFLIASCGCIARNWLDNHGNEDKALWYSADNPGRYVGFLLRNLFWGSENVLF